MAYKELNDYFPDGLSGNGIFTAISQITWFPGVVPAHVDTYFMLKHGEKLASKVCDKFADSDGHITGDKLNALASVLHNAYFVNWEHEFKTLTVEYNPIENTDYVETVHEERHTENTGNAVTTGEMTTTNTNVTTGEMTQTNAKTGSRIDTTINKVAGFDSASNVDSSDTTSTSTSDPLSPETDTATTDYGTLNDNPVTVTNTTTSDYGLKTGNPVTNDTSGEEDGTYDRTITKHGNIGVTTNAEMIRSDLDVWKLNNFYDILCSDICKVIALSIF